MTQRNLDLDSAVRCPQCNAGMVLRQGPRGRFYGCPKYPECRGTRPHVAPDPTRSMADVQDEFLAEQNGTGRKAAKRTRKAKKEADEPAVIPSGLAKKLDDVLAELKTVKAYLREIQIQVARLEDRKKQGPVQEVEPGVEVGELPAYGAPPPDDELPF